MERLKNKYKSIVVFYFSLFLQFSYKSLNYFGVSLTDFNRFHQSDINKWLKNA